MASQTLKNSHAVPPGMSIIERLEKQMDKRRKTMEAIFVKEGRSEEWFMNVGRYEGLAAAIALMRSGLVKSNVAVEVTRSNERLGIE